MSAGDPSASGPDDRPPDASGRDWVAWHEGYDGARSSYLPRRLAVVQAEVRAALDVALDAARSGPVRVLSMCAGQGRDLLGVLAEHPRAAEVEARLVELDPRLVARARADAAPWPGVQVVEGDAGQAEAYAGIAPAQVLLVCGVFGNVSEHDIDRTVGALPALAAADAQVVWTRHRLEPDRTPWIRQRFAAHGFAEEAWVAPGDDLFGVGRHRLDRSPDPFPDAGRLFAFTTTGPG